MKSTFALVFGILMVIAHLSFADEKVLCFDNSEETLNKEIKLFEQCGVTKDNANEENFNEAYICVLEKMEVLDENNQIVIEKFKETEKTEIVNKEEELMAAVDECAENKPTAEPKEFIQCYDEKVDKLCPDDKDIFEEDMEE
uniref:U-scoloptoxin(17)-Er3a n=1 Tax=Ethmostigmus rubripes TaxID=62613 RepID=TXH3A_ETHRU|nr:RecName: Full=U-scoloptoxin(17)-Er3a; Short=U-SLPTX(17)-Er3a; Flags: Precursor [Ethmostigmus rubripes]